jgi:hypothetical protein
MRRILATGLGAVACLAATAGTARAQDVIEAKVPFPFLVGGQSFPAGHYRIEREGTSASVLLIRGDKGITASTFVSTLPAGGRDPVGDRPVLTFKRHENQYRLSEVWESGSEGQELMR